MLLALSASMAIAVLAFGAQTPAKADAEFLRGAYDTYQIACGAPRPTRPRPGRTSDRRTSAAARRTRRSPTRTATGVSTSAYATSGVWKTDDDGATWQAVFENMPSTSIGDVAVSPSNPDIVWVGTGEANIFRASMPGVGIYKSSDAGRTWQHMGLTDTQTISRIVVHPTNPDIVYVAATGHEWTDNDDARRLQDHRTAAGRGARFITRAPGRAPSTW